MAAAATIKGVTGENLRQALGWLPTGRELITVRTDCDLSAQVAGWPLLDALALRPVDRAGLLNFLVRHGFRTWRTEIEREIAAEAAAQAPTAAPAAPLGCRVPARPATCSPSPMRPLRCPPPMRRPPRRSTRRCWTRAVRWPSGWTGCALPSWSRSTPRPIRSTRMRARVVGISLSRRAAARGRLHSAGA